MTISQGLEFISNDQSKIYDTLQKQIIANYNQDKIKLDVINTINQIEIIKNRNDYDDNTQINSDIINSPISFIYPARGIAITSEFGYRVHPITGKRTFHAGIDFGAATNTPVYASADGLIETAGWLRDYGNAIVIDHGSYKDSDGTTKRYKSLYGHNTSLSKVTGSRVRQGEQIALSGTSGFSTGPHIHFEITVNGKFVDPLKYLTNKKATTTKNTVGLSEIIVDDPYAPVNGKFTGIILKNNYTVGGQLIIVEKEFGLKVVQFLDYAHAEGKTHIKVKDGYRSYEKQKGFYDAYKFYLKNGGINPGIAAAPNVGNHRLGKAVDFFLSGNNSNGLSKETLSDFTYIKNSGEKFGLYNNYGINGARTDLPHFSYDGY